MFKSIISTAFLAFAGISALNGCGYSKKQKTVKVEVDPTPFVGTRKAVLTQPLTNTDRGVRMEANLTDGSVASAYIPKSAMEKLPEGTTATMFVETSSKKLQEDYGIPEGTPMVGMKLESTTGTPIQAAPVIYTSIKRPEAQSNVCESSPYKSPGEHLSVSADGQVSTVPVLNNSSLSNLLALEKSIPSLRSKAQLYDPYAFQDAFDDAALSLPLYPYPDLDREPGFDTDLSAVDLGESLSDFTGADLSGSDFSGSDLDGANLGDEELVPLVPPDEDSNSLIYNSAVAKPCACQCGCSWATGLPKCGCNCSCGVQDTYRLTADEPDEEQVESGSFNSQLARNAPMPKGFSLRRTDFPYPEVAVKAKTKKSPKTKRLSDARVVFSEAWKTQWRNFFAGEKWLTMLKEKKLDPTQISMVISAKATWDDCEKGAKSKKSKVLRFKFLASDFATPGDLEVALPLRDPAAKAGLRRCLKTDFNRSFFIEPNTTAKNCGSEFNTSSSCLANTKELISHDINLTILAKSKIKKRVAKQSKLLIDGECPTAEEENGILFAPGPDGSILSPVALTTEAEADDTTAPVAGSTISATDVADTSLTLNWTQASDDVTSASDIQYRLAQSTNAADIDSIEEVDALSSGLLFDYQYEKTTHKVESLSTGTNYHFALVAKDEAGNKVLYSLASQTTTGKLPPVAGTALAFSSVLHTTLLASWGVASDSSTAPANLQYKLVKASSAAAIDSVDEANAISGTDLLMDWTANTLSQNISSLSASTTYYLAVLVKDEDGEMTLYSPQSTTTAVNPHPVVGTALSFSNVAATTITVNWGAATDPATSAANLEYKLVKGSSLTDIDTIDEVEAKNAGNILLDWTANALTHPLTGLATGTRFYFAVLVRNASGYKSLYAAASQATVDQTAPTIGTVQKFSGVSGNSITVTWGAASDNLSAAANLQYKLVTDQTAANIDSVSDADAITGSGLIMDWTANTLSATAGSLTADTKYFFVILVKDEAGNKAIYSERPRPTGKMIYTSASDHNGFFAGTAGAAMLAADSFCSSARLDTTATDVTVKAMLASSVRRACTNANCSDPLENLDWVLAANTKYHNGDGDFIGQTNAAGIFAFPTTGALAPNIWIFPWTGLQADWRTDANTCFDWTTTGGFGRGGQKGHTSGTPLASSAISGINLSCSISSFYVYYCAEQ